MRIQLGHIGGTPDRRMGTMFRAGCLTPEFETGDETGRAGRTQLMASQEFFRLRRAQAAQITEATEKTAPQRVGSGNTPRRQEGGQQLRRIEAIRLAVEQTPSALPKLVDHDRLPSFALSPATGVVNRRQFTSE